jgi:hypothetical protein
VTLGSRHERALPKYPARMTAGRARLQVDGEEVPLIDTVRLFQTDPRPGGHRYSLVINGDTNLGIEPTSAPSRPEQEAALWAMDRLAAGEPGEPTVPARFILNSVELIHGSAAGLVIEGICSVPVTAD